MRYWLSFFLGMTMAIAVHGMGWAQTGNVDTKTQLTTDVNTNWPDNSSGLITPVIARQTLLNAVQSYQQAPRVRANTAATDTIGVGDYGFIVTESNASPVAVTLPQATTTFATFNVTICNLGVGTATITPTTSTINGVATLTLKTTQCSLVVSDGTNWQIASVTYPYSTALGINQCPQTGQYLIGISTSSGAVSPICNNYQTPAATCTLVFSVSTNVLTVSLQDHAGFNPTVNSPCIVNLHNPTSAVTANNTVFITTAKSISTVVGASLGSQANTAFRFWVLAMDDGAGSVQLGLYNATVAGGACQTVDEAVQASSTAIGAGSTNAQTIYTTSALTNKYVKILGYLEYNSTGLVTPGTYATGPNFASLMASGTKKPCDTVQMKYVANTSAFTTTSNTFQTTNLTLAITPNSAANLIFARGMGSVNDVTATSIITTSLFRSATQFGTTQVFGNNGTNGQAPMVMEGFDQPNTTSSTTYSVKIHNSDNTTNVTFGVNSNQTTMTLVEIMG